MLCLLQQKPHNGPCRCIRSCNCRIIHKTLSPACGASLMISSFQGDLWIIFPCAGVWQCAVLTPNRLHFSLCSIRRAGMKPILIAGPLMLRDMPEPKKLQLYGDEHRDYFSNDCIHFDIKGCAWIPWKLVIPSRFISCKTHFLILAGSAFTKCD